nr:small membrane protein [Raoultella ornithinolytica]
MYSTKPLLVAVFSLVSYIKDRKKQQFTFKKRR